MAATALAGACDPGDLNRLARTLDQPLRSDTGVAGFFARVLEVHRAYDAGWRRRQRTAQGTGSHKEFSLRAFRLYPNVPETREVDDADP